MKRAQTEIVGIVFIVLILVIAGFFMIVVRTNKEESLSSEYVNPELAQSFLNVILDTKTEINSEVSDILLDCAQGRNDACGANADCCEYARQTISNALKITLGEWKKPYKFSVKNRKTGQKLIPDIPENSVCDDAAEKYPPSFRYLNTLEIRLDICK